MAAYNQITLKAALFGDSRYPYLEGRVLKSASKSTRVKPDDEVTKPSQNAAVIKIKAGLRAALEGPSHVDGRVLKNSGVYLRQ